MRGRKKQVAGFGGGRAGVALAALLCATAGAHAQVGLPAPQAHVHAVRFQQAFFTVDFESFAVPSRRPAKGYGVVVPGTPNASGVVEFQADAAQFAAIDQAGVLSVSLPQDAIGNKLLVIVVPDSTPGAGRFATYVDLIDLDPGAFAGTVHVVAGAPVFLPESKSLATDGSGAVALGPQRILLPVAAGTPVEVGQMTRTTASLWDPTASDLDPVLGAYALGLPAPVATMQLESSDVFMGLDAIGQPTRYAAFDADTGHEIADGPIDAQATMSLAFSAPAAHIALVFYGTSSSRKGRSSTWSCVSQPANCELVASLCEIVYMMIPGTGLCNTLDGWSYLPPAEDGSALVIGACWIRAALDMVQVEFKVVNDMGVQVELPIPGAPVNLKLGTTTTTTTSTTALSLTGASGCRDLIVPTGKILVYKFRHWWCVHECGYCSGSYPNVTCYIGDKTYADKEHFTTTRLYMDFDFEELMIERCDKFPPGLIWVTDPCP